MVDCGLIEIRKMLRFHFVAGIVANNHSGQRYVRFQISDQFFELNFSVWEYFDYVLSSQVLEVKNTFFDRFLRNCFDRLKCGFNLVVARGLCDRGAVLGDGQNRGERLDKPGGLSILNIFYHYFPELENRHQVQHIVDLAQVVELLRLVRPLSQRLEALLRQIEPRLL